MKKVVKDAAEAVRDIPDGASVMISGFGLCGIPENLIAALRDRGPKGLTLISNNAGTNDFGITFLLQNKQVKKMIATYVGENKVFEKMALAGEIEVELNPQGTFAERMRAGGVGRPRVLHPHRATARSIAEGKEVRWFGGRPHVMETALRADYAFVKAWKGDTLGNLVFRRTTRNFAPMMAMAARTTIAEVEELVPAGALDPDAIVTPGIFVQRIFQGGAYEKRIEKRTLRGQARRGDGPQARAHRAAGGAGDEGRLLREPRHRHADARRQLRARGRVDRPALRERHARRRPVPRAGPGGRRTSSTRARRR